MIHQPMGSARGQASDIIIQAKEINRMKKLTSSILALHTGQLQSKIEKDQERDYYMSTEQAKEYGLIDKIIGPGEKDILKKVSNDDNWI
jgi:ATP-dependent Clp protease protease subunit